MRQSWYKYYSDRRWAEQFLEGKLLFRSLSYFRDYEDKNVRGDRNEGVSVYGPAVGLVVTNHTQGKTFTLPASAFESAVKQEEIFAFCASRSLSDKLRDDFEAVVCVEITRVQTFCTRVRNALPPKTTFYARKVKYYQSTDDCNPRWALPDLIATSKLKEYERQEEVRLIFSLTDALDFEKISARLALGHMKETEKSIDHHSRLVETRSLRDICRIHEF
jgi:hypothetical protein